MPMPGKFRSWVQEHRCYLRAWWDSGPWIRHPAPAEDRCYMGAPIGRALQCRRPAVGDTPWCAKHNPDPEAP